MAGGNISLLNLSEPILDCILKLLSPMDLIRMSEVCTFLRDRCRSDPLWEVHMKRKWGGVIGDVAYKEWQWHITTSKEKGNKVNQECNNRNGSLGSFSGTWPMLYLRSYLQDCNHLSSSLANSFMALYFSLENGKFWFPAQVYKETWVQEVIVRYDSKSDDFVEIRQQNGDWHAMIISKNIKWDKLRAPPVDNPPWDQYVSDCLQNLKPGDHIEIQWKSIKYAPYDWWYGVVGHMDLCGEKDSDCLCRYSETLMVEFKQYLHGSMMKSVKLLRNGEQCEEPTRRFGGIRKLESDNEIQRWEKFLPPFPVLDRPIEYNYAEPEYNIMQ